MDITKIRLEEKYVSDTNVTTLYFTAPKEVFEELTGRKCGKAEFVTISIEYTPPYPNACGALVMVSPTRKTRHDGYEDYEWTDVKHIPSGDIERLIGMA